MKIFSKIFPLPRTFGLISPQQISSRSMKNLILICFFISGACGLIYEIAWLRTLGLIFGNTTFATSAVLAGYMAGLGLGAFWWGRRADRQEHPVKIYAWLEAGVGSYALLTPLIWILIDLLTIGFYRFISPSFVPALIFKLIVAFLALLVPSFLMGATLPVISKYFVRHEQEVAKQVGLLYGLNTFGAMVGVLVSGFFAIEMLGVRETVFLAAGMNFLVFFLCSYFQSSAGDAGLSAPEKVQSAGSPEAAFSPLVIRLLLAAFAVSGAVSMMYEVAWTRVLATVMGSSVYAFSIMLATFLLGISLGSYGFSLAAKKLKIDLSVFSLFQMLTALTAILGIFVFQDMPYYFLQIYARALGSEFLLNLGKFALCASVMLLPTVAIGAMFSCFVHVLRRSKPIGREIGEAYFANTLGTIAGSILTGFVIIPLIGAHHTLLLAAGLNTAIGLFAFAIGRTRLQWKRVLPVVISLTLIAVSASFVRPWDRGFIASGLAISPDWAVGKTKSQILDALNKRELAFYKEGLSSTVAVHRVNDVLWLSVNGKADASSDPRDAVTQALLGYIPMMLHPDPKKVLIIGLGSGFTATAVATHPVQQIDVVEIEKAVVEAADHFKEFNRHVLADPRVRLHINDGRNFALLTPEKYDVVISEPSNPWMAGVANLFSREHYQTLRKRLAPGGIVCQWLQTYSMSPEDLRMVVKTFVTAFPETSIWTTRQGDLLLIGKKEPLVLDMKNAERSFQISQVQKDLKDFSIHNAEGFFSHGLLFQPAVSVFAKNGRVNSDDHPFLEFSAPRNLYRSTVEKNAALLEGYAKAGTFPEVQDLEPPQEKNVSFQNALARGYLFAGYLALAEAALEKAVKIGPPDAETFLLLGILQYHLENQGKALRFLSTAARLRPQDPEAHYYAGLIFQSGGRNPEALVAFRNAAQLGPQESLYLTALANHLLLSKQDTAALEMFTKALALDPGNVENWRKRTTLTFQLGTLKEKKYICEEVLRRYPKYEINYQLYGDLLFEEGNFAEALSVYLKLLALAPRVAQSYINLAKLSHKLGNARATRTYLRKAIRYSPKLAENLDIQKMLWA
ncbi:MAG: fused MFS/spermidine synthase [Candidatus Omnitrophota bacterium]